MTASSFHTACTGASIVMSQVTRVRQTTTVCPRSSCASRAVVGQLAYPGRGFGRGRNMTLNTTWSQSKTLVTTTVLQCLAVCHIQHLDVLCEKSKFWMSVGLVTIAVFPPPARGAVTRLLIRKKVRGRLVGRRGSGQAGKKVSLTRMFVSR